MSDVKVKKYAAYGRKTKANNRFSLYINSRDINVI